MTSIARRSLIKGVLASTAALPAASVAAALPAPHVMAQAWKVRRVEIPAPAQKDAELIRLGRDFAEREVALRTASAKFQAAAERARAGWPHMPGVLRIFTAMPTGNESDCPVTGGYGYADGERQNYSLRDESDMEWRMNNARALRPRSENGRNEKAARIEYAAEELGIFERYKADCAEVRERFGIPPLYEALRSAKAGLKQTIEQIYLTAAETIDGLAVKARVFESEEAKVADCRTAQFKMPGSIARDIAWIAAGTA